jgi:predicted outer membrane repeat protein
MKAIANKENNATIQMLENYCFGGAIVADDVIIVAPE